MLRLEMEPDGEGGFCMSDPNILVYGHGKTVFDALADYSTSLREYCELLAKHEDAPTKKLREFVMGYLYAVPEPESSVYSSYADFYRPKRKGKKTKWNR